ncbi:MAG TPA: M23 family metallopeptidase [Steroidobacteraceae bacterium]|nr:M23 family metallopeptidase [Steroidobacteraceae bacterium]
MALVIVSAGTLASSRLRTVTLRPLAAAACVLALAGLAGGFALGYHLGGSAGADAARLHEFADLDPALPGNQALIQEIGSLSGRLIQLEAVAGRLSKQLGARPPQVKVAADSPAGVAHEPAGGPLLAPTIGAAAGTGASLLRLNLGLDQVETSLDGIASMVARRNLDGMAFPSRTPIPGVAVSSGFGRRIDPFTQRLAQHAGIDYSAAHGTTIHASAGGRIRRAGPHGAYGRTIEIDHGDGLVTRYGHVYRVLVRVGDVVLPGQAIATVGSTGRSTGPHLHFEILRDGKQVHPDLYLAGEDS